MVTLGKNMFCKKYSQIIINFQNSCIKNKRPRLTDLSKHNFAIFNVRRKMKIALFPLTCRRQGRVGRSENLFIFCVFFSFLKMGKKVETC